MQARRLVVVFINEVSDSPILRNRVDTCLPVPESLSVNDFIATLYQLYGEYIAWIREENQNLLMTTKGKTYLRSIGVKSNVFYPVEVLRLDQKCLRLKDTQYSKSLTSLGEVNEHKTQYPALFSMTKNMWLKNWLESLGKLF